ncbi:hypothetical protein EDC01DRAFT_748182, partial [Geopyxis carbonaria]
SITIIHPRHPPLKVPPHLPHNQQAALLKALPLLLIPPPHPLHHPPQIIHLLLTKPLPPLPQHPIPLPGLLPLPLPNLRLRRPVLHKHILVSMHIIAMVLEPCRRLVHMSALGAGAAEVPNGRVGADEHLGRGFPGERGRGEGYSLSLVFGVVGLGVVGVVEKIGRWVVFVPHGDLAELARRRLVGRKWVHQGRRVLAGRVDAFEQRVLGEGCWDHACLHIV